MTKWNYHIIRCDSKGTTRSLIADETNKSIHQLLNEFGEEGWELVAIFPARVGSDDDGKEFYLKRQSPKLR